MPRLILSLAALVVLVLGVVFSHIGWSSRRQWQRVSTLPRWDAAEALVQPIGTAGLLEGQLSSDNPELEEGFVLYFRSGLTSLRKDNSGRRGRWESLERRLPALIIDSGGQQIYTTADYAVTFLGSDPNRLTTEELEVGVTEKLEGLFREQPVTLVGRIAENTEGERIFETERLASGSADDLVSGEASGSRLGLIAGGALLFIALILIAIALSLG